MALGAPYIFQAYTEEPYVSLPPIPWARVKNRPHPLSYIIKYKSMDRYPQHVKIPVTLRDIKGQSFARVGDCLDAGNSISEVEPTRVAGGDGEGSTVAIKLLI